MARRRAATVGLLLALGLPGPAAAAEFATVVGSPSAFGPRAGEGTGVGLLTALEPGASAYGLSVSHRGESGFLAGLNALPAHRNLGPNRVELGVLFAAHLGYAFDAAIADLGRGRWLAFSGGLLVRGQAGTGVSTDVLGTPLVMAGLSLSSPGELETLRVYASYRPVVFGTRDGNEDLVTEPHGLQVGATIAAHIGEDPGAGFLVGAALDARDLGGETVTGLAVEVGLRL